ncbi:hypothetical protein LTH96_07940 [Nesterenkonia sp. LB17]|uniref:hypothetical protein n=1 Tax=unclassified Nesterenkonia TaxID=2629769 RepID=UPI001F4C8350|nr:MULTISPECIES: hypothetical protein [unclassified Nesterenkonia]MCH8560267.1 hypothetical protein [Nesterenkonia sp. DZ6]MCH8563729.1 hypothetical protein [Nesterenkonia sp. YGD6]MCH8565648.1 hypothetical protein [Nesterenkonia sp. LB17]MCH8571734.1 hypothetical protein [Nesterenkonia sp. AY15]
MKRSALAGSAAAAVVLLAGCGGNPFAGDAEDDEPQVPSFGQIQDRMWDAMLTADTVNIEGEIEAAEADVDQMFQDIDEDDTGDLLITGAVDGSDSEMTFTAGDVTFTQRAIDGVEYFRGEDFAALLMSEMDEEITALIEEDFITSVVVEQWVQFSTDGAGAVFSAQDFISTWQRELEGQEIAGLEGTAETRDGAQVYVYATEDGSTELVVAADGAPYLVQMRDEDSSYVFSAWNETQRPDQPENVMTLDEIFEAIAAEHGWSTEELDGELEDENNDDAEA